MKILLENSKNFNDSFKKILNSRKKIFSENVDEQVKNIIHEIKKNGDKAIVKFVKKYDQSLINKNKILIDSKVISHHSKKVNIKTLESFKLAIKRITKYHKKQYPNSQYQRLYL